MAGTPGTSDAHGAGASRIARGRRARLPETGAVTTGLGIGLACLVADRLAPPVASPLLWTGATIAVGHLLYRQFREPVLTAPSAEALRRRLIGDRPAAADLAAAGGATALGGGSCALLAEGFFEALDRLAGAPALPDAALCLAFLGAFALFARGLDRGLVWVYREALYRTCAR